MIKNISTLALAALVFSACQNSTKKDEGAADAVKPPVAEKVPHEFKENGGSRVDDYYWMKLTRCSKKL